MKKTKSTQLNCFSPPVMLATLVIEFFLAAFTIWRYKMTALTRLITAELVFLATFQLSEYFVCTGYGTHAEQWSRLGFVAISTLPPLGLHIMHKLAGKPARRLVFAAYATMAVYILIFLTYKLAFIGHQCTGNYVIFQIGYTLGGAYGLYYYGWLLVALVLGWKWASELMSKGKPARSKLEAVRALMVGYLVFLIPTAVANTVRPETRRGIPSIMCGFAVLFALILALYILPRAATEKNRAAASGRKAA